MLSDEFMKKLDDLIDALHEQSDAVEDLQESIEEWKDFYNNVEEIV